MEVVNPRSALLSNHEVLTLLRELDSAHLARAKTAIRIKKEEESAGVGSHDPGLDEVCENLRTVEVEAIQYLSAEYQPTISQSEVGITNIVKGLAPYELTKAEKLQIVNLAPAEPVELYVIVEELEDRLGEHMDDILAIVRASLSSSESALPIPTTTHHLAPSSGEEQIFAEGEQWDEMGDVNAEFDDTGEGAGVEGDLDMEDD